MEKNDDQRPLLSKEFLRLLHEDVHLYQHLLTLLGKERECLRTLSVEELCVTAKVKETELLKIKVLEQTLRDMIGEFLTSHNHADKKASLTTLTEIVDARQARVLKNYVSILAGLKEDVQACNTYNKRFIEDSLDYIEDSISILLPPAGAPVYTPHGTNGYCSHRPNVLSREV